MKVRQSRTKSALLRGAFRPLAVSIAAVMLCATVPAFAGSATWQSNPPTGDWNTAGNWTPNTIPNASVDIAGFGASSQPGVAISSSTTVDRIVLSSGGSNSFTITVPAQLQLTLDALGITNNSSTAGSGNFTNNGGGSFAFALGGHTVFNATATAGSRNFTKNGGAINGAGGGGVNFQGSSSAGTGTFTRLVGTVSSANGGPVVFDFSS